MENISHSGKQCRGYHGVGWKFAGLQLVHGRREELHVERINYYPPNPGS